ncbi:hypothetical protein ACIBI8_36540 [Streptomyces sp. NPDC050529]|uniref:hypothetical protein n=1 Tax=Streptomyces sp. NPDC050529 TaxID=3365624 RepID=UPI0037AFC87E
MLAHAFLAVVRADEHTRSPAPDGLVPLPCNEIQRLFTMVVEPRHDMAYQLGWSRWRQLHQQRSARRCGDITYVPTQESWLVHRDGSGAYGDAVRRALPDGVQVSNRWHI